MCVFAPHNFSEKDPHLQKWINQFAGNVLIYMDAFFAEKKALTTFHYALKRKGISLCGKSLGNHWRLLRFVSHFVKKVDKIYSRKACAWEVHACSTERKRKESICPKEKKPNPTGSLVSLIFEKVQNR